MNFSVTFKQNSENPSIEQPRKTGGGGKAILSAMMPGVGQLVDERIGAGLFSMGTCGLSSLIIKSGITRNEDADMVKAFSNLNKELGKFKLDKDGKIVENLNHNFDITDIKISPKNIEKPGESLIVSGTILLLLAWVYNIYDAYKGSRKKN